MSGSEGPLPGERAACWRDHVAGWRRSGLTARDYCRQHGLNRGTLGYWASRLRRGEAPAPTFLPVEVAATAEDPTGDAGIVLELESGLRLRMTRDFDAGTLARVLAVVRS